MRNQPTDPWEVEAARRREVIESDFGAPHGRLPEVVDGAPTTDVVRPFTSLIAGITRTLQPAQTEGADCLPHGRPGFGASKSGT